MSSQCEETVEDLEEHNEIKDSGLDAWEISMDISGTITERLHEMTMFLWHYGFNMFTSMLSSHKHNLKPKAVTDSDPDWPVSKKEILS